MLIGDLQQHSKHIGITDTLPRSAVSFVGCLSNLGFITELAHKLKTQQIDHRLDGCALMVFCSRHDIYALLNIFQEDLERQGIYTV